MLLTGLSQQWQICSRLHICANNLLMGFMQIHWQNFWDEQILLRLVLQKCKNFNSFPHLGICEHKLYRSVAGFASLNPYRPFENAFSEVFSTIIPSNTMTCIYHCWPVAHSSTVTSGAPVLVAAVDIFCCLNSSWIAALAKQGHCLKSIFSERWMEAKICHLS